MLRVDRGEEPKITMIRVSHAKQYFVLAFSAGPFELWDIKKLCLLRYNNAIFKLFIVMIFFHTGAKSHYVTFTYLPFADNKSLSMHHYTKNFEKTLSCRYD